MGRLGVAVSMTVNWRINDRGHDEAGAFQAYRLLGRFFNFNVFVLVLEISVLLFKSNVISLSIFEIVDIVL